MEAAGISVEAVPARVDERALEDSLGTEQPEQVAMALAMAKTDDVSRRHPDAVVLGADQVLWDGREVFGKPEDPEDHMVRLLSMRGRRHDLITGWSLRMPDFGLRVGMRVTSLQVRADLQDDEILAYVESGEGSECAGGYAIEGHGLWLFEAIEGDWHNIIGLPVIDILSALRGAGWRYGRRAS